MLPDARMATLANVIGGAEAYSIRLANDAVSVPWVIVEGVSGVNIVGAVSVVS